MCPACLTSVALVAAEVGSTGGVLALFVAKIKKFFTTGGPGLVSKELIQKQKEK